ncbi:MAG: RluA family pseudouridine synthase [Clostridia bacterium]|nr:RluA family pseudouridine synthase [Clostridia bacterium]
MANDYLTRKIQKNGALSKVLSLSYPEFPYNLLMKLLRKKDVFLNGKRVADASAEVGDEVRIFIKPNAINLKTLFINEDILAVYKPKGVSSDGEYSFASLVAFVYENAVLLHRLDTNTDGILLFALNPRAEELLLYAMMKGEVIKEYRAVVYGEARFKNATLTNYLLKDSKAGKVKIYDNHVKNAEKVTLEATTISIKDGLSTLKVIIHGGKTHQIRAQLAANGYFIIGDGKYGDDRINRLYGKKSQELTAVKVTFALSNDPLNLNGIVITLDDN